MLFEVGVVEGAVRRREPVALGCLVIACRTRRQLRWRLLSGPLLAPLRQALAPADVWCICWLRGSRMSPLMRPWTTMTTQGTRQMTSGCCI